MRHKCSDSGAFLTIIGFVILLLTQAIPFMEGYRLTADDVTFHHFAMSGWPASWAFIKGHSFGQGRIVQFVDLPFSLLGSYYADYFIFRLFYTALYFSNFLLIGLWASLFLFNRYSRRFIVFVAVVLISFHPLDFFHLAPNAYPFHVSLPVFLILTARIGLWHTRRGIAPQSRMREVGLLLLFFVGLIFSEYGFLFGLSLVVSEYFVRLIRVPSDGAGAKVRRAFIEFLRRPSFVKDVFAILFFLALYLGFRFVFPSSYDGNQISSDLDVAQFIKTLWGHIYGGTSIASFVRYDSLIVNQVINLGLRDAFLLLLVSFSTFYVSKQCLAAFTYEDTFYLNKKVILACGLCGLFVATFITIPVALTAKYQGWCGDINSCIFLDSRVSYLGVGLIIIALCCFVLSLRSSFNARLVIFASLAVAAIGATSYLNNKRIAADMGDYSSAWDRGKKLACVPEDELRYMPISRIVDPKQRLSYHPGFDREHYWLQYLKEHGKFCEHSVKLGSLFPRVTFGQPILFKAGSEALAYLLSGWSTPESWGTWSDSSSTMMFLPIKAKEVESIIVEFNVLISPSHLSQRVEILMNGIRVSSMTIRESPATVEVEVPDAAKLDSSSGIKIEFLLPDAARPKDVGLGDDGRTLALGLLAITLR
jgi:hypothetical protein